MSSKLRLKLLEKIAQAAQPPANETTGPTTVSGSPTKTDVLVYFPTLIKAWGPNNIAFIQKIVDTLNEGIFVLSKGQMDFNTLRVQAFNVDTSKYPDRILTNIIKLSQLVYNTMLNDNGKPYSNQLTAEIKASKVAQLNGAVNTGGIPDGSINQFLMSKIGGNLKSLITSNLSNIK